MVKLDPSYIAKVLRETSSIDHALKRIAKEQRLNKVPSKSEIISILRNAGMEDLIAHLKKRPSRSLSGVTVIAVMSRPYPCPHGRCAYCPGGPSENVPQSYTGYEPATMRGIQHNFDPYAQVASRIQQLEAIGHTVDKIEVIVMGGTFISQPEDYQNFFMKGIYEAIIGHHVPDLETALRDLETASRRVSGVVFETRPDWCFEPHVDRMLAMGGTAVEIGVQTVSDVVYRLVERGHTVDDVAKSFAIAREAGFKITAHIMPGLPGLSPEEDFQNFRILFEDERFKPDALKIYPTLVIKGTKLYEWWKEGKYQPLEDNELIKLIARMKRYLPRYVRIKRIQRDIPVTKIDAGFKKTLREEVQKYMEERGWKCRCIRCREVGHTGEADPSNVKLQIEKYLAAGGYEYFLTFRDIVKDSLIAFLRLRALSNPHRPELKGKTAIIRELHVYGVMVPVGVSMNAPLAWQHQGYGRALIREAERIATEELDASKIAVISGRGVRPYYYMLGYSPDGPYVSKKLRY
ncbi:MAG: tRNA uridine(34) 5-carboxymethylaminomethyl modification radical SAM/GNAT enzyme Elp3 [Candidatus Korarchaeota archaeon]